MRAVAVAEGGSGQPAGQRTPVSELEFVGCEPVRVSAAEIDGPQWEGRRVEYWHAASETAWIVQNGGTVHDQGPGAWLAGLVCQIGMARGSEACCIGATDIRIRNGDGTEGDLMQADQAVYLDPARAEPSPHGHVIVGENPLPDVVLEVDHMTDVRPGKLLAYEDWRLPEVWVEVPDRGAPDRRGGLPRGLRIYLLEERPVPGFGSEPGVSGLAGGRDPPGAERGHDVGGDRGGALARGPHARRPGGHRPGGRPPVAAADRTQIRRRARPPVGGHRAFYPAPARHRGLDGPDRGRHARRFHRRGSRSSLHR